METKSEVVLSVILDRTKTPTELIISKRKSCSFYENLAEELPYPLKEGECEVHFFFIDRPISNSELEKEYSKRDLVPNPITQLFADGKHKLFPNGTSWKGEDESWRFLLITENSLQLSENRKDFTWDVGGVWFSGIKEN